MKQSEIINRTQRHMPTVADLKARIKNPVLRFFLSAILKSLAPLLYAAFTKIQVEIVNKYETIESDVSNFDTHLAGKE